MISKNKLFVIFIIVIVLSLVFFPKNKSENTTKNVTNYNFEFDWWLKPQTFGMFNYYSQTNYTRLKITNCTVNGYRLVYDLNKFNYKKDIEDAHKKGIKYVIGMLFDVTKDKVNENPNSICLPYETIKNNSFTKAKKIVDLGADGLTIVHPFGGDLFVEKGVSCLCPENSRENLTKEYQLNCAVEFYKHFVKEIKDYAKSKHRDNFPITIASHGEWLIPFTVNMLPFSDFAYANLDKIEDFPHAYEYKLHFSATNAPLIISPMDASFGWLLENSNKTEDLIQILMTEAYANKGAFQDQDKAGLSPSCIGQGSFANNCWLDKSVNASTVEKMNSFYLANKDLFDFNSESMAKIGVLFSPSSIKSEEHWSMFEKVSKILSLAHYQYDVLFSENSDFSKNTLTLKKLQRYKLIILPQNTKIDSNTLSLITKYLSKGGNLIAVNPVDSRLNFPTGTKYVIIKNETKLFHYINNTVSKRILDYGLPKDVGIQLWKTFNKTIIHLVNYNFDLKKGIIEKNNISVNLLFKKKPISVKILSPDFDEEQNLKFNFSDNNLQFIVPKLKVWDVLVIE